MCMRYLGTDLGPVLGIDGKVAQGKGCLLLHTRARSVAAHCRDQGLDPPLCVCVCVCLRLQGHIYSHVLMFMHYLVADHAVDKSERRSRRRHDRPCKVEQHYGPVRPPLSYTTAYLRNMPRVPATLMT